MVIRNGMHQQLIDMWIVALELRLIMKTNLSSLAQQTSKHTFVSSTHTQAAAAAAAAMEAVEVHQ